MAFLSFSNVKFAGVAAAVPKIVKEIKDLSFFSPGEADKVIALTHIERSRMVPKGMCCSDLCYEAAEQLIERLQWNKQDIGAMIYVSLSRDYLTPHTSALLQDKLGLSKECYAIDVPLACSGYVYGLSVIAGLMQNGGIKKGLLLVGETTSQLQSPLDKTIWPLHGDGGTATALEFNEGASPMLFHFATDGSRGDAIINLDGGILVGMEIVEPNDYVLVITEKGYGKKTPVDEYRITNRGGKGVKTVNITEKNGSIVSFKTVDDSKDIMIITDSGIIIRLAVDKISTMSRVTQGVKLINLKEDSIVSSTSIVDREEVSDDNINGEKIDNESE